MGDCELLGKCRFIDENLKDDPAMAEAFRMRYCNGFQAMCARHTVYRVLGFDKVPPDLYPNHHDEALAIIEREGGIRQAA